MNKCKYCGRKLRDKNSIKRGFGPVCGRKYADVPGQLSFEDILPERPLKIVVDENNKKRLEESLGLALKKGVEIEIKLSSIRDT